MAAREFSLDQTLQGNTEFQDYDEAKEETLSLCDLAEDSNNPTDHDYWSSDSFSKENQTSSSDQDFFEFFSEDFTASTYPKDHNIIFCGKLIPFKEPPPKSPENTQNQNPPKKTQTLFPWKSQSFHNSRIDSPKMITTQQEKTTRRTQSLPATEKDGNSNSAGKKFDFPVRKVSIVASSTTTSPVKPRWYLFMFGMGKFPLEMELRDMRTRQSRRSPAAMFQSEGGGQEMVKNGGSSRGGGGRRTSGKKGLWGLRGLLKVFGCRTTQHANTVVKASLGFMPHV